VDVQLPPVTPGAVVVTFAQGRRSEVIAVGHTRRGGAPMTADTVFEAASLSKPVIARFVLGLAVDGALDLHVPFLTPHLLRSFGCSPEVACITPAMVLTHTTGLPNWRTPGADLALETSPGSPGYSGEAFELLLAALAQRFDIEAELDGLLRGLQMPRSSFVWQRSFEGHVASGHTSSGQAIPKHRPSSPRASGSLHTTAADYATFVERSIWPTTPSDDWLHTVTVRSTHDLNPFRTSAWAWHPTAGGPVLWQHGDNAGFKHLAAIRPDAGDGVLVFTNGDTGWALVRQLASDLDLTLW
jgi:CubicO group peptidase (beta-lactamase class C family)